MQSHYCCAETKKMSLEPGLNIRKMYELYKRKCEEQQLCPVKNSTYRHIFSTEYNLGFHHPRKDQCLRCKTFKAAGINEELQLQEKHDQHLKRKETAQTRKKQDKEEVAKDSSFVTATFDLQSVLHAVAKL